MAARFFTFFERLHVLNELLDGPHGRELADVVELGVDALLLDNDRLFSVIHYLEDLSCVLKGECLLIGEGLQEVELPCGFVDNAQGQKVVVEVMSHEEAEVLLYLGQHILGLLVGHIQLPQALVEI